MVIILAVLAMIVIQGLDPLAWVCSRWRRLCRLPCSWASTCTSSARAYWRVSVIGFVLLDTLAHRLWPGGGNQPTLAPWFDSSVGLALDPVHLAPAPLILAMLPDLLRSAVVLLAHRHRRTANLQMPALTLSVDGLRCSGSSPHCRNGAVSGFHALISSGTTPGCWRTSRARLIGYGGMLMESAVASMAMIAAYDHRAGVYLHGTARRP